MYFNGVFSFIFFIHNSICFILMFNYLKFRWKGPCILLNNNNKKSLSLKFYCVQICWIYTFHDFVLYINCHQSLPNFLLWTSFNTSFENKHTRKIMRYGTIFVITGIGVYIYSGHFFPLRSFSPWDAFLSLPLSRCCCCIYIPGIQLRFYPVIGFLRNKIW